MNWPFHKLKEHGKMIRLLGDGDVAGSGYAQRVKESKEAKTKSITQQQNRHLDPNPKT
jgi:hypothetical protein